MKTKYPDCTNCGHPRARHRRLQRDNRIMRAGCSVCVCDEYLGPVQITTYLTTAQFVVSNELAEELANSYVDDPEDLPEGDALSRLGECPPTKMFQY